MSHGTGQGQTTIGVSVTTATVAELPDIEATTPMNQLLLAFSRGQRPALATIESIVSGYGLCDDALQAGTITLAGLLISHKPDEVFDWCGYDLELMHRTVSRLIWNGIWGIDGMYVTWPEDTSGMAQVLDSMVGAGILRRTIDLIDVNTNYLYSHPDALGQPPIKNYMGPTIWMVAKRLVLEGYTIGDAITVVYRAWLDRAIPDKYCPLAGEDHNRRAAYFISRVVRPPQISRTLLDHWFKIHRSWLHYLNNTRYLMEVRGHG